MFHPRLVKLICTWHHIDNIKSIAIKTKPSKLGIYRISRISISIKNQPKSILMIPYLMPISISLITYVILAHKNYLRKLGRRSRIKLPWDKVGEQMSKRSKRRILTHFILLVLSIQIQMQVCVTQMSILYHKIQKNYHLMKVETNLEEDTDRINLLQKVAEGKWNYSVILKVTLKIWTIRSCLSGFRTIVLRLKIATSSKTIQLGIR